MNISKNDKINDFLADIQSISPEKFDLVLSIRNQFLEANNELEEDIKYGGIVFAQLEALIGGIYLYKEHISIEFSHGADFVDPRSILEGSGKKRRHLKISSADDIVQKNIKYYINQAASA